MRAYALGVSLSYTLFGALMVTFQLIGPAIFMAVYTSIDWWRPRVAGLFALNLFYTVFIVGASFVVAAVASSTRNRCVPTLIKTEFKFDPSFNCWNADTLVVPSALQHSVLKVGSPALDMRRSQVLCGSH